MDFLARALASIVGLRPSGAGNNTTTASQGEQTTTGPDTSGRPTDDSLSPAPAAIADTDALLAMGEAYWQQGAMDHALACFEQLVEQHPDHLAALRQGAKLYAERQQWAHAADWARRALAIEPDNQETLGQAVVACNKAGHPDLSVSMLEERIPGKPDSPFLHIELGSALRQCGRFPEAIHHLEEALRLAPGKARAYRELVTALRDSGQADKAANVLDSALDVCPDNPHLLLARASAQKADRDFESARQTLMRVIELLPASADPWLNLCVLNYAWQRFEDGVACARRALELKPDSAEAHMNLAMGALTLGWLKEGWAHYQWRFAILKRRDYSFPPVPGDPLIRRPGDLLPYDPRDKHITLIDDQGLGDELSFLRFAPLLRDRGARVTYMPDPRIASLVRRAGIVDRVAELDEDAPLDTDLFLACGDVPLLLDIRTTEDIPPPVPLPPLADEQARFQSRLADLGLGRRPMVGLTWRGGTKKPGSSTLYKEAPLEAMALLLKDLPVDVLVLQRNPVRGEIDHLGRLLGRPVYDFSDVNANLEAMLALVDALDDYVTVSNTNVHLRAGRGKPVHVLIPSPPDYRWMATGDQSPWFPGISIYRQAADLSWDKALGQLHCDLWRRYIGGDIPTDRQVASWPTEPNCPLPEDDVPWLLSLTAPDSPVEKTGAAVAFVAGSPVESCNGRLTAELASSRYRLLLPGEQLARRGYHVQVASRPKDGWPDDAADQIQAPVVVFSKSLEERNEALARSLKARGRRIVVDLNDNHFDHPDLGRHLRAMCELADDVTTTTAAMAAVVKRETGRDALLIGDPIEGARGTPAFAPRFPRLQALWFGHSSNLDSLEAALPQLAEGGRHYPIELTVLTKPCSQADILVAQANQRHSGALHLEFKPWSQAATWEQLAACDLVVIPSLDDERKTVKSPNRLLETIWAGRLAVVHPQPACEEFSPYCIQANDLAEGIIQAVAGAPRMANRIEAGQAAIALAHSSFAIASQWEAMLFGAVRRPVRLNLGCGDKILPDYLNVDVVAARAGNKPDLVCDLRHLAPLPDAYADEILSVHVIEHFWRWEALDVLKEWVRVLKPGGTMILECPNIESACRAFLANPAIKAGMGPESRDAMWVFYGDPAWRDPYMVHRWGYTPGSLAGLMREAGLRNIRVEPAQFKMREPRDMRLVGNK